MASRVRGKAADAVRITIMDLLSYRVSRAASLMSRGAAMRYRREFGVSLGEWRALALLAVSAPQSLMQLARAAGLDKAQMSRVVSALIRRGLVVREPAEPGRRLVSLTVTQAGRALYAGLIAAAADRNALFCHALERDELLAFTRTLDKLADQARALIKQEAALLAARP